jgi:hypothetical protein
MEYMGVRYTIRAHMERDKWTVTIYPSEGETVEKITTGRREKAIIRAKLMIDSWLKRTRREDDLLDSSANFPKQRDATGHTVGHAAHYPDSADSSCAKPARDGDSDS